MSNMTKGDREHKAAIITAVLFNTSADKVRSIVEECPQGGLAKQYKRYLRYCKAELNKSYVLALDVLALNKREDAAAAAPATGNDALNAAAVNYYATGKGAKVEAAAWAAVKALPESAGAIERMEAADKAARCTPSGQAAAEREDAADAEVNLLQMPVVLPPVKKLAGFTASDAGGAVFVCEDCGKRTRQTIAIELGTEKCLPCTVKAYTQNEHLDKHDFNGVQHTGEFSMDTCPACKAYGAWLTAEYKK